MKINGIVQETEEINLFKERLGYPSGYPEKCKLYISEVEGIKEIGHYAKDMSKVFRSMHYSISDEMKS